MAREITPDMPVGATAHRKPVCVGRSMTILAASKLMRLYGIGELVVTDLTDGRSVPAAIVSTRDIVTRVIATELDAAVLTAGDIVWSTPVAARTTDTVSETLRRLLAAKSNVIPATSTRRCWKCRPASPRTCRSDPDRSISHWLPEAG